MVDRRITLIKDKIEELYPLYLNGKDEEKLLLGLAQIFRLPIDKSRIKDYYVESFDREERRVVVVDVTTQTVYRANFTDRNEDRYFEIPNPYKYVEVTIDSSSSKEKRFYTTFNKEDEPLFEKITFREGDRELAFTRDTQNCEVLRVQLSQIINNKTQPLITKVYKKDVDRAKRLMCFNQVYTYGLRNIIECNDEQDVAVYRHGKNITYSINRKTQKDSQGRWTSDIRGICIENLRIFGWRDYPLPCSLNLLSVNNCEELYRLDVNSAIYLQETRPTGIAKYLTITKSTSGLLVKFVLQRDRNRDTDEFSIPAVSPGTISKEEIDLLINSLENHYRDDDFIAKAKLELLRFRREICIQAGLTCENDGLLEPEKLFALSGDEIKRCVLANKEAYFEQANKEYTEATDLSREEPAKSFCIKIKS